MKLMRYMKRYSGKIFPGKDAGRNRCGEAWTGFSGKGWAARKKGKSDTGCFT